MRAFLFLPLTTSIAIGQAPAIGGQQRIDTPGAPLARDATNETASASAEINPLVAVAAWNDHFNPGLNIASTTDGGVSWVEDQSGVVPNCSFDPMAASDPRTGTLWVGGATHDCGDTIWVSRWNGSAFDAAVNVTGPITYADKPFMAAGPIPGVPNSTRLYVVYFDNGPKYLKWSDSLGAAGTWQGPVLLPQTPNGVNPDGPLPRVGPNGELYIIAGESDGFPVWLYRWIWTPGQSTIPQFSTPQKIATRLDKWPTTGGRERFPGSLLRVPARHYLAVDPISGTLYAVWFDTSKVTGTPQQFDVDIYLAKSSDQGTTWSSPTIVNVPDGPPYDQFFPWIEVDANRRLHMVFYDTLGAAHTDQDFPAQLRTRYAWSTDFASTWTEVTIAPLWSGAPATWPAGDGSETGILIGDYNGMGVTTTHVYPVYMSTLGPLVPDVPNQNIYSNVILWP